MVCLWPDESKIQIYASYNFNYEGILIAFIAYEFPIPLYLLEWHWY
jgi:hypothetical protein